VNLKIRVIYGREMKDENGLGSEVKDANGLGARGERRIRSRAVKSIIRIF
jgi:hypothetical protein